MIDRATSARLAKLAALDDQGAFKEAIGGSGLV
jgi:hypothetical protein